MSERTIRRWTRGLIYAMFAGFGVGIALALVGMIIQDDTLPAVGLGAAALWTLVVLIVAAYMGGQALARFGGLVGLALIAGIVLGLVGGMIAPWVQWIGIAIAVLAAIGFVIMGLRRHVPVWIGGRSNSG